MACRVGITTEPKRRRREWERKYPNLRNWKISIPYGSKSLAQNKEDKLAQKYRCKSHHGGGNPKRKKWYVYKFEY